MKKLFAVAVLGLSVFALGCGNSADAPATTPAATDAVEATETPAATDAVEATETPVATDAVEETAAPTETPAAN